MLRETVVAVDYDILASMQNVHTNQPPCAWHLLFFTSELLNPARVEVTSSALVLTGFTQAQPGGLA
jgi:hypothetical protein